MTAADDAKLKYSKPADELEAYYGLPREVKFCTVCVMSNQRPNSAVEFEHTRDSKKQTLALQSIATDLQMIRQRQPR